MRLRTLICTTLCVWFAALGFAVAQQTPPTPSREALLAAAQRTATQAQELLKRKSLRSPAERRVDSGLLDERDFRRNGRLTQSVRRLETGVQVDPFGRVNVTLLADVSANLLADIRMAGGEVRFASKRFGQVEARVPLNRIEVFAALRGVRSILREDRALTNTGAFESEGDVAHGAQQIRNLTGLSGAGAKVGVLSDSVDHLAIAQSGGDLPASIDILPGQGNQGNGTGEGTAMLEIVHDLAPGADLAFATGVNGQASMATNILALEQAGCDVIVDDLLYLSEPAFEDGPISLAIKSVVEAGSLYFTCAANTGRNGANQSSTWEGNFDQSSFYTLDGDFNIFYFHKYTASAFDYTNRLSANRPVTLQWADPWMNSQNDYDLFLVDSSGNIVASSTNAQPGAPPLEWFTNVNTSGRSVVIGKEMSSSDVFLRLSTFTASNAMQYRTGGNVTGHNAARWAFSIGATGARTVPPNTFGTTATAQSYSADGPRRMFFDTNGNAFTPGNFSASGGLVVNKPDFLAADDVQTSNPGALLARFRGTSAAAPHAAAIAALLWDYRPNWTYSAMLDALRLTAIDVHTPGWDVNSGWGTIRADLALTKQISDAFLSVTTGSSSVVSGQTMQAMLNIGTPAPPLGLTYQISLSNTNAASAPTTVTVMGGASSATFAIQALPVGGNTQVSVTATQDIGPRARAATFTVTPAPGSINGISVSPTSFPGGETATGTITLRSPAPTGGRRVNVRTTLTGLVSVPTQVTVPAGETSTTFAVDTIPTATDRTGLVYAFHGGSLTYRAQITVRAPRVQTLSVSPEQLTGGSQSTGTFTLDGPAPAGGISIRIRSTDSRATVPPTVNVPAGATQGEFVIQTVPVGSIVRPMIRADRLGSGSRSATLTVVPPRLASMEADPQSLLGGLTTTVRVWLTGPAPANYQINLASSHPQLIPVPSPVTVPAGESSWEMNLETNPVTTHRNVRITASRTGSTQQSVLITLNP
jgi:hypothetical protein